MLLFIYLQKSFCHISVTGHVCLSGSPSLSPSLLPPFCGRLSCLESKAEAQDILHFTSCSLLGSCSKNSCMITFPQHIWTLRYFFSFFFLQLDPPSRYWIGFSQPACRTLICLLQTICLRTQIEEAAPLPRVFNADDADACRLARTEASLTCSQVSEMKPFMENVVVLLMLLPLPVEAVTYGSHHAQTRQSTMWLRSWMFTRFSLLLRSSWISDSPSLVTVSKIDLGKTTLTIRDCTSNVSLSSMIWGNR